MRATRFFISTLKDAPADADVVSQKLMLRAGMIKKLAAGIYSYMPMGLRVIKKVEAVVREEMSRAGAIELLMPVVQPAELWMETGRWQEMGPLMLRIKDRHDRDFVLQPTCEEVIADIVRQDVKSYRQLPVNFYHIQTKFRDERRPRFGVMRGREFTMKDAYSFDRTVDGATKSYDAMFDAYVKIFTRLGLTFRPVEADTGNIGGERSHEFQVIADTGEDALVYCPTSDYAANMEKAECVTLHAMRGAPTQALVKAATPGMAKCEDVATFLNAPLTQTVKSIVLATEKHNDKGDIIGRRVWLLLIRGDHELNEVKVGKLDGLKAGFRFATEAEIVETFGCTPGYLGAVGLQNVTTIADRTVANMSDFVTGANEVDFHYTVVNWGRDLPEPALVADMRNAVAGDPS
ncbi:MAG: proline--tRNA ligase, partial [Pseudomonadota bacterium]